MVLFFTTQDYIKEMTIIALSDKEILTKTHSNEWGFFWWALRSLFRTFLENYLVILSYEKTIDSIYFFTSSEFCANSIYYAF